MKEIRLAGEEEFVEALRHNERTLMNRLYKLHFPMVLHFIVSNNGSEAEAKDIYQEAFIVLYENVRQPGFALQCKIKTYLYSVSRRLWLKRLGQKKLQAPIQDFEDFLPFPEGQAEAADNEKRFDLMEQSLNQLGEPCRTILEDYYIGRLSMVEIAQKMGYTNADNAKTQKYKCLNRLKKIAEKQRERDEDADE